MKHPFIYLSLLALVIWSCGGDTSEKVEPTDFETTNKEGTFVPLEDPTEFVGVYHFGESEMETSFIFNKANDQYFAQIRSGSFNDEGTAFYWEYENLTNVSIEDNKFFSDKTNGEFLVDQETGTHLLKVYDSWSYENQEEIGYKSGAVEEFHYGDYDEASYKILTENELQNFQKQELKFLRNEIFARYGFIFKAGGEMDQYFNLSNWYYPLHKNVDAMLTPLEKENIDLIKKIEAVLPANTEALTPDEMEGVLAGNWICNSSKMFSLSLDGTFHAQDYNYNEEGEWQLKENRLAIFLDNDTIIFEIEYMDRTKMVIGNVMFNEWHNFLCQTGSNYRIYSTLYKERSIGRNINYALVGNWYNSEGFELKVDGTYIHNGPDCENGTWKYRNNEIIVTEEGCGGSNMTFELLTTERLVLDENWTLFRMHDDESAINTPKSE